MTRRRRRTRRRGRRRPEQLRPLCSASRAPKPGASERRAAHTRGSMRPNGPAAADADQRERHMQGVRGGEHLPAPASKGRMKGVRGHELSARAPASTSAKGANARSAGGREFARTSASRAHQKVRGGEHLPAPAPKDRKKKEKRKAGTRTCAALYPMAIALKRRCLGNACTIHDGSVAPTEPATTTSNPCAATTVPSDVDSLIA